MGDFELAFYGVLLPLNGKEGLGSLIYGAIACYLTCLMEAFDG
jgi:hypothetical protein